MAVSQQSDATSRLIAALLGPVFVISGLLVLFNPQALPGIIRAFVADPTLVVLAGYMSFVPGLAIVYFHNRWARGWPLLVTLSGWICVVVGAGRIVLAYRLTPLIGRSNLEQAVPVTFGYKMAGLLAAVERHRERLAQIRPRVLQGEFAGAAGTLASLETGAMETQAGLCAELGLAQPVIAWHTVRDTIAEVGTFLGLVGGTLGKISMDVKLMMQTEVGEVYEPYAHGRGSSSTMPQKRNPISSCYIHAQISVLRQHAAAMLDAMVADHERSTGPWEIEWIVLPEAFCLLAGALAQSRAVIEGLEVDTKRMRANLDMTHGLVVSEAVMMGLAPYIGREYAHDLVYDICRVAIKEERPLLDLLAENAEITQHVTREQLAAMCDPAAYLGQSGVMVDRVLARWQ